MDGFGALNVDEAYGDGVHEEAPDAEYGHARGEGPGDLYRVLIVAGEAESPRDGNRDCGSFSMTEAGDRPVLGDVLSVAQSRVDPHLVEAQLQSDYLTAGRMVGQPLEMGERPGRPLAQFFADAPVLGSELVKAQSTS